MSSSNQLWETSLVDLQLLENEIHIWRTSLQVETLVLHTLQQMLSKEEVFRAKRFHFERDRRRFIVARGILRSLLGRYLHTNPGTLNFDCNAYGKPSLGFPLSESKLHFNISHSHEVVLFAFTRDRQIGVDVEYMRSDIDYEHLARHSFSSNEQAAFYALPSAQRQLAFYHCWTRKEAYIKARGQGLSLPLDLFDVSLVPDEPAMLLSSREDPQEVIRWSFQNLLSYPGYAGAFAVEGYGWQVNCWQWQSDNIL